ncbi:MAG: helix-turn-helix transcriptional regulator [Clostridiales bacterium]|nr:helix-turn-helix transcriptional regulator [Clostridiales bacterium]
MDVRDRIRNRRAELGLTLEQVGEYVGVSKSTVKKWESGYISNMKRDKLAKLAEVLQISPIELIDWETGGDMHLTITDTDPQLDELNHNARQLNANALQKLVDYSGDLLMNPANLKTPLRQPGDK